ncbi:MAG TPA: MmgE/PrpD family protein [Bosea sp. (in: a-proteobacteria)]|jgi:2-methylcitrate dehydratase PrpD|uniref:MmgE/PrpD family protein n=1 Tax=Bosea sp. (in: a-proteobacteria) TaxID=1871050 RepID=UPI002E0DADEB|nr:MmgE/PrpD family protein [Bosea sp. (in: a-proteobacteria)]
MTGLEALATRASALALGDLPEGVRAETKRMLLDMLACVVAAQATRAGDISARVAAGMGHAAGRTSLMGDAYLLARLGDAMDFEEGCAGAHFGCGAVAAALALARVHETSGADLLLSIATGYELAARLSAATGSYYVADAEGRQVFAPVWGIAAPVVMAAVGAGARLRALEPAVGAQAYAHALSNAPVPIGAKWNLAVDLPDTKYCDTGWCALAGLGGVLAAEAGSTALPDLVDGDNGFFRMLSAPNARPERLTAAWGESWAISGIVYKDWPCCGMLLPAMANLTDLLAEHAIEPTEIEAIHLTTGAAATSARFANQEPATFASRQFSFPHAFAMLCLGVPGGPDWLSDETDRRADVQALRRRVTVGEHDPHAANGRVLPLRRRPSSVTIKTARGSFSCETDLDTPVVARHERRWTDADAESKFRALVDGPEADTIIDAIRSLETLPSVLPVIKALDRARPIAAAASNLSEQLP